MLCCLGSSCGFIHEQVARNGLGAFKMSDRHIKIGMTMAAAIPLLTFVLYPLWAILKMSFLLPDDSWGLGNYTRYFSDPGFIQIVNNSFVVSISSTVVTIVIAYIFAYALHRSSIPYKAVWKFVAMLPLFAPSLVQALGFQLLLGRNGAVNRMFGTELDRKSVV